MEAQLFPRLDVDISNRPEGKQDSGNTQDPGGFDSP
jgi:hypothetical protein